MQKQLSKKRELHPLVIKQIKDVFIHGGKFYPSTKTPQPHITFKDKGDKRRYKNKPKEISEMGVRRPSIGQLARMFDVNKTQIKKALGIYKERPIPYRAFTVSGKPLPNPNQGVINGN